MGPTTLVIGSDTKAANLPWVSPAILIGLTWVVIEPSLTIVYARYINICYNAFMVCAQCLNIFMPDKRAAIYQVKCDTKLLIHSQTSLLHCWSLGKDKQIHLKFQNVCNYSSMLGLKWNHTCKRGPRPHWVSSNFFYSSLKKGKYFLWRKVFLDEYFCDAILLLLS